MNRILGFSLTTFLFFSACVAFAQSTPQPPLGDYARAVKKTKSAPAASDQKKVYDNDNLPAAGTVSVVGNSATDSSSSGQAKDVSATAAPAGSSDEKKGEKKEPEIKPGQSIEERKQAVDAWKKDFDDQAAKITKLSQELDLLQREYRVKAADFYSNTANRAQNPTGFAKEDADYKQQIAEKQQAIDAAKAKLTDMQDKARQAGVPSSAIEQN